MIIEAKTMDEELFSLLKSWCDGLLRHQISMPGIPAYDGGILCPACKMIHGRCHDAIYPMMYMADRTGDSKYLIAAKKLFDWGENMLCDDGSMYNDAQSTWNGITVFYTVALHDALVYHGQLLDAAEKARWEARMAFMANWLYTKLRVGMPTNINYFATNACAMALMGEYFGRDDYRALARELAHFVMGHMTENTLLYGEGKPMDSRTAKGCTAIDVAGYNVEESLPSLCRYALVSGDAEALELFKASYRAHVKWMLPDGAWDNSVGTRNFKWTYWGSRTTDGCQEMLLRLGREETVFAEAAWRNFELYKKCTHDGLLYGGPDYAEHGEYPCTHHTFCHAKALTGALDEGAYRFERQPLPSDGQEPLTYYPELDTWRVAAGDWRADVTAYDFDYMKGGHASGGALSMLWHRKTGPVVAVGAVDYSLHEVHNQQLSLKKAEHRSTCPRIETERGGVRYGQHYDFGARLNAACADGAVCVTAEARLCDALARPIENGANCKLEYRFTESDVTITGQVEPCMAAEARYILPVISGSACVQVAQGSLTGAPQKIFDLNPGFICDEYVIAPDAGGAFSLIITVQR